VPGLEISVVFEAAGEGIEIGGDLYDVLPTEDGCWILIADVAGKGSAAAGVSVAVRHAVRGLTREIDDPELTLPHPRMWERGFVLAPLRDVAPDLVDADATWEGVHEAGVALTFPPA